jgi:hypothetical protein
MELQKVRDMTSFLFFCKPEDDVDSLEVQMVQDITSFLFFCVPEDDVDSLEVQQVQDITSFLLISRGVTQVAKSAPWPSAEGASRPSAAAKRPGTYDFSVFKETEESLAASRCPKVGEHPWPKVWVRTMQ